MNAEKLNPGSAVHGTFTGKSPEEISALVVGEVGAENAKEVGLLLLKHAGFDIDTTNVAPEEKYYIILTGRIRGTVSDRVRNVKNLRMWSYEYPMFIDTARVDHRKIQTGQHIESRSLAWAVYVIDTVVEDGVQHAFNFQFSKSELAKALLRLAELGFEARFVKAGNEAARPCCNDTNGDGNCGKAACPQCNEIARDDYVRDLATEYVRITDDFNKQFQCDDRGCPILTDDRAQCSRYASPMEAFARSGGVLGSQSAAVAKGSNVR